MGKEWLTGVVVQVGAVDQLQTLVLRLEEYPTHVRPQEAARSGIACQRLSEYVRSVSYVAQAGSRIMDRVVCVSLFPMRMFSDYGDVAIVNSGTYMVESMPQAPEFTSGQ